MNVRNRRRLLESLEERAARLELERDQQGKLAAAAERARIARELHDVVAHNLTVMIALSDGAAYALRDDPDEAEHALETASRTGRLALAEMRRLLGVLREDRGPGPGAQTRSRACGRSTRSSSRFAPPGCRSATACRRTRAPCPRGSS